MYQTLYEDIVRFASQGDLESELPRAKAEYVSRTGELFESDPSFERRIAAFLEWYVLDRKVSFNPQSTPAQLFAAQRGDALEAEQTQNLDELSHTVLSLFEYKRSRPDGLLVRDLLRDTKVEVYERRKPAGLEAGDILEARLVPFEGKLLFADAYGVHPREARKAILKAAKRFRKEADQGAEARLALVHRVAYFANRCERYKHVSPKQIFAELEAKAA